MPGFWEGRGVVVTGAASGIGRQLARDLARAGASLALLDRDEEGLRALARELDPVRARLIPCDLTRPDAATRALAELGEAPVDVLVNNAGLALVGRYESGAPEDIEAVLAVNLLAPLRLSRALLPRLIQSGRGFIVNIASLAGLVASPGLAAYAASKHGLVGFSESLGIELEGRVGVCAVCPSFVRTGIALHALGSADGKRRQAWGARVASMGAEPEKVSRAVMAAVEKDRRLVLVNADAALLYGLNRLSPWLSRAVAARLFRWNIEHALLDPA